MSDYIDRIHDMVFELTKIVAETKERGLMELWTMVVGSTIIPELLKGAPDFLETNPEYKEIVEAYTREKVLEKMAPKTVEVPVEKTVEKIVEVPVEKTVERIIHVESAGRSEPLHEPCMDGGKHRRLKDKVAKVSRKKRGLQPDDRDAIITYWNDNQRLVDKEDPVCQDLATQINDLHPGKKPLSPLQIAGYFSRLATWGRLTEDERESLFDKHMSKYEVYTVRPVYTSKLLDAIRTNYLAEQEDLRIRQAAKAKMKAERDSRLHGAVTTPAEKAPVVEEPPEEVTGSIAPETPRPEEIPAADIAIDEEVSFS